MITTVSVALYALAVFFAAGVGVTSVKFKNGKEVRQEAVCGVVLTAIPFALASILLVAA